VSAAFNNIRRFVIGDIHGCISTFKELLKKVGLQAFDHLYILGDMIDRGPSSANIIDYILELKKNGFNIFPIRGNHEQMIITINDFYPEKIHKYLRFYGSADLLNRKGDIKKRYQEFLRSLPLYIELDDFILVHASLDMSTENIFENTNAMLYAKYHVGNPVNLNGKRIIHGHTVKNMKTIKNSVENNSQIICIDNGCVYGGNDKNFGKLVCLNLDTMELTTKKYCG
jgi:serine/threonine protein phosphatase 1